VTVNWVGGGVVTVNWVGGGVVTVNFQVCVLSGWILLGVQFENVWLLL
jgi:hypothetical protein